MPMRQIEKLLAGGDRRSIGRSNQVVKLVLHEPRRFRELVGCLFNDDPIVRIRAADAAEKISAKLPRLLDPYKRELLGLLCDTHQIEVRWHLAQMVPRLTLDASERQRVMKTFERCLDDRSSIVKTFALQGMSDLVQRDESARAKVKALLEQATRSETPAMKARARKLLATLKV